MPKAIAQDFLVASLPVGESTRVWVLGKYENGDDITHGVTADREKALAWETGDVDQYASPFDLELRLGESREPLPEPKTEVGTQEKPLNESM